MADISSGHCTVCCACYFDNLRHNNSSSSTSNKSSRRHLQTSFCWFLIRAVCLVYYALRRLLQIADGVQIRSYSIISHCALLPWCDRGDSGVHGRTRMDQLQWETDCSLTPADLFCFLRISQWQNYPILLLHKYDWGWLEILERKTLQNELFVQIVQSNWFDCVSITRMFQYLGKTTVNAIFFQTATQKKMPF